MIYYQTFAHGPRKGLPKTLKDRVIRFLTEGLQMVPYLTTTRKYMMFEGKHTKSFYFVGKNGGVRSNNKPSISGSVSITDAIHNNMPIWEKKEKEKCK